MQIRTRPSVHDCSIRSNDIPRTNARKRYARQRLRQRRADTSRSRLSTVNLPRRAGKITRMPAPPLGCGRTCRWPTAAFAGTTVAKVFSGRGRPSSTRSAMAFLTSAKECAHDVLSSLAVRRCRTTRRRCNGVSTNPTAAERPRVSNREYVESRYDTECIRRGCGNVR